MTGLDKNRLRKNLGHSFYRYKGKCKFNTYGGVGRR